MAEYGVSIIIVPVGLFPDGVTVEVLGVVPV